MPNYISKHKNMLKQFLLQNLLNHSKNIDTNSNYYQFLSIYQIHQNLGRCFWHVHAKLLTILKTLKVHSTLMSHLLSIHRGHHVRLEIFSLYSRPISMIWRTISRTYFHQLIKNKALILWWNDIFLQLWTRH